MSRALRIEFPGAVYHVTSRGNERREVFRDDEDRRLFLSTLGRTVARWRWVVHAYCLMGNHYHLLIETPEPNLSRGMRQLNGEYTQAFNRRHGRAGHLFQGRFKAVLVEKEGHLLELCRYVVLNPVRARGMRVQSPEQWPWSSYRATAGQECGPPFLDTSWVLARFGGKAPTAHKAYRGFVADGAGRGKAQRPRTNKGLWIGSEVYGEALAPWLAGKRAGREYRMQERLALRPGLKTFFPAEALRDRDARDEAICRAYREGRYSQREIGDQLGLHYATISVIVRRQEKAKRVEC